MTGCAKDKASPLTGGGESYGERPAWADRAPDYGYGSSAGVAKIGPKVGTYRFGRSTLGKVEVDQRTDTTKKVKSLARFLKVDVAASESDVKQEVEGASAEKLYKEHKVYLANPDSQQSESAAYQNWAVERRFIFTKPRKSTLVPKCRSGHHVSVFLSAKKEAAETGN